MPPLRKLFVFKSNLKQNNIKLCHKGEPVWPVVDIEEENALLKLSEIYFTTIEFVTKKDVQKNHEFDGLGTVIAFNNELSELAALYAHLTKRKMQMLRQYSELSDVSDYDIILTLFDEITFDLMDILYSRKNSLKAPGIICGKDKGELRKNILMKSALLFLNGYVKPDNQRIDFFPLLKNNSIFTEKKKVICGDIEGHIIRDNLSSRTNLLYITTHSTNLDANFGNLILCPFSNSQKISEKGDGPFCLENNFCNRLGISKDSALKSNKLISPTEIKAQVLIFSGCHTVAIQKNKVLENKWGHSSQFISNIEIGVFVANWKVILSNLWEINQMVNLIDKGESIGNCIGQYNSDSTINRRGNHFCIFGDPDINILNQAKVESLVQFRKPSKQKVYKNKLKLNGIFLLRLLFFDLSQKSEQFGYTKFKRALSIICNLESATFTQTTSINYDNKDFFRAIGIFSKYSFFREMHLMNDWLKYLQKYVVINDKRYCDTCGSQVETIRCNLNQVAIIREILNCPSCGIIQDSPQSTPFLEMTISDKGKISLKSKFNIIKEEIFIEIGIGKVINREFKSWKINTTKINNSTLTFDITIPLKHIVSGPTFIGCFIFYKNDFIVRKKVIRGQWLKTGI